MLRLSNFDYDLPKNLIASRPCSPRDKCKLLVYYRSTKEIKHTRFDKILKFLQKGDVLVFNDTKVIPARIIGRRITETGEFGRKFEVLLLKELRSGKWEGLISGKNRRPGLKINFGSGLVGEILKWQGQGVWLIKFNKKGNEFWNLIFKLGKMPIPPYIKQKNNLEEKNKKWYQTVYAKHLGSVAAPTAGLHFTKRLLKKIKRAGVQIEYITLHIGLGTFAPVRVEDISKHQIHSEYAIISSTTAQILNQAKNDKRRIIAVGTSTARALEAVARDSKIRSYRGKVELFIYPPYQFKFIDGLITNFHLPCSTLLMMVSAFLGGPPKESVKLIKKIYQVAIERKYKFYSYGDAMAIF
jgi:S-adenosylmethionine:tRNA ribosyltransferase-isomerase